MAPEADSNSKYSSEQPGSPYLGRLRGLDRSAASCCPVRGGPWGPPLPGRSAARAACIRCAC